MKKQLIIFALVIFVFFSPTYAKKLGTTPELLKPIFMAVDSQQFYAIDNCVIYIYSLKDFKLKKKFGKAGEGPREFKSVQPNDVMIFPQKDSLVISSVGKISFYKKDGAFIKEMKTNGVSNWYQPLGNKFAAMSFIGTFTDSSLTINIIDESMTRGKEIHRQTYLEKGAMTFPMPSPAFFVRDNKIVTMGNKGFSINVFDQKGEKITSINREYTPLKVTQKYREGIYDIFKANPRVKPVFEYFKKNVLKFAEEFPPIQFFSVKDGKIYILTFLEKDGKYEFFIYGMDGKFIKRLFLPLKYRDAVMTFPYDIKNNTLYQLIETEEEEWQLHGVTIE